MSERATYSRVYWSIVDDPKFETIYDDDRHLAAWLRLLLIADQAHPASAHLPTTVRRASVTALSDVGLIDLQPGSRYRVHGLDAERGRRREAATRRRTGRDPTDDQLPPKRDPTGIETPGRSLAEPSRDETRRANARDGWPHLDGDAMAALEERTGHVWSQAGDRQLSEYDRLVGDHGLAAVCAAFDTVSGGKRMTARQLVWPALRVLEPFAKVEPVDEGAKERAAVQEARRQESIRDRRLTFWRGAGQWDPAWGPEPKEPRGIAG